MSSFTYYPSANSQNIPWDFNAAEWPNICIGKSWKIMWWWVQNSGNTDFIDRLVVSLTEDNATFCRVVAHPRGSMIVQNLVRQLSSLTQSYCQNKTDLDLLMRLVTRIVENVDDFLKDESANFVVQEVLKVQNDSLREYKLQLFQLIINKTVVLSSQKYASRVVEVALLNMTPIVFGEFMKNLFCNYKRNSKGNDAVDLLLFDEFGNYVIQCAMKALIYGRRGLFPVDSKWFDYLTKKIRKHENRLVRYTAGKTILSKLNAELSNDPVAAMFRSDNLAELLRRLSVSSVPPYGYSNAAVMQRNNSVNDRNLSEVKFSALPPNFYIPSNNGNILEPQRGISETKILSEVPKNCALALHRQMVSSASSSPINKSICAPNIMPAESSIMPKENDNSKDVDDDGCFMKNFEEDFVDRLCGDD